MGPDEIGMSLCYSAKTDYPRGEGVSHARSVFSKSLVRDITVGWTLSIVCYSSRRPPLLSDLT